MAFTPPPPPASGMTGGSPLVRAARLCAVLAAPLLALSAAPAAAQTVSITSTPVNGEHYVVGEAITTRISGIGAAIQVSEVSIIANCAARHPETSSNTDVKCNWMNIDIGGVTREAWSTADPGGQTYVDFKYIVQADNTDTDGVRGRFRMNRLLSVYCPRILSARYPRRQTDRNSQDCGSPLACV